MRTAPAAILALLLLVCSIGVDLALLPHDAGLGRDFSAFYAGALALRRGLDPYSVAVITTIEAHLRTIGDPHQTVAYNGYVNPPLFAWMLGPLARLPQPVAYVIWLGVLIAALGLSIPLVTRAYGGTRRLTAALLVFMVTPISVICLFLGQQTPLLVLGLSAALLALRRHRPALAGALLTVGWIKPHLLLPVAVVIAALLGWREARRLIAGFIVPSILWGIASLMLTGSAVFASWLRLLVAYGHAVDTQQPLLASLAGLYLSVVGRPWDRVLALVLLVTWIAGMIVLARRARAARLTAMDSAFLPCVSISLASWLLVTPLAHPHDLVLLLVALPAVIGPRLEYLNASTVRLALGMLLTAPEADLLGFRPNYVMTYSVLVSVMFLVALRPWRFPRPGVHQPGRLSPSVASPLPAGM